MKEKIVFPAIAIENPYTLGEISDFVRLSKVFKTKLYLITEDIKSKKAIKEFLKENSFDKANVEIIKDIKEIKETLIGFSMWGKNTLQDITKINKKKLCFIFGNEKRGLKHKTMENCKLIIKIGNASEPLRATQANAFAFGFLYNFL